MIYDPCCSPFSQKTSFRASKWPQKLKTAKNSKLPKLPETCFGPVGEGGWPPISTWINTIQGKTYHIICSSLKILCIGHVDYFIRIMLCMNNIKFIIIARKTPISGFYCGTTSPFSIFSVGF
jgi:hypothetical protein